jgi:predicted transcriptional regulator YheO
MAEGMSAETLEATAVLPGRTMLETLKAIVPDLAKALGADHEVVVHDLARIPNSIVAIGGTITGRTVGGPITDLLLRAVRQGETDSIFRYQARTTDGRLLTSSTVFIKDPDGTLIGCLCINRDITEVMAIVGFCESITGESRGETAETALVVQRRDEVPANDREQADTGEIFPPTVEDLAVSLVAAAIADTGVPVDLMQKRHKMQVITELDARGLFLLRDAVELTASMLQVSRESVYGYLKETRGAGSGRPRAVRPDPSGPTTD